MIFFFYMQNPEKLIGLTFEKDFNGKIFHGKVMAYDDVYFKVQYEDGDTEDLTIEDLHELIKCDGYCGTKKIDTAIVEPIEPTIKQYLEAAEADCWGLNFAGHDMLEQITRAVMGRIMQKEGTLFESVCEQGQDHRSCLSKLAGGLHVLKV